MSMFLNLSRRAIVLPNDGWQMWCGGPLCIIEKMRDFRRFSSDSIVASNSLTLLALLVGHRGVNFTTSRDPAAVFSSTLPLPPWSRYSYHATKSWTGASGSKFQIEPPPDECK